MAIDTEFTQQISNRFTRIVPSNQILNLIF